MMYDALGCAVLGVSTFVASAHANESCGLNGLPLTPNSVKILGEFQWLKSLRHKNICRYVDIVRGQHERLMVVLEHHGVSVESLLRDSQNEGCAVDIDFTQLAQHITSALKYLHQRHLVVGNISSSGVVRSADGVYKLSQFGLYHMSSAGTTVSFPIGQVEYMSPEVLAFDLCSPHNSRVCSSDIWSLGVLLARAALGIPHSQQQHQHSPSRRVFSSVLRTLNLLQADASDDADVLQQMAAFNGRQQQLQEMNAALRDFINRCLTVDPGERANAEQLMKHHLFDAHRPGRSRSTPNTVDSDNDDSVSDIVQPFPLMTTGDVDTLFCTHCSEDSDGVLRFLRQLPMNEVYHLWQLSGGDLHATLSNHGLIKLKPAILNMPTVVTIDGENVGERRDRDLLYDPAVVELCLDALLQRLSNVSARVFFPLLYKEQRGPLLHSQSLCELSDTAHLPLVIKEADIEYQLHRVTLLRRLLMGYPHTMDSILREARVDVAPLYRGYVWSALLGVTGVLAPSYYRIDKQTPVVADRQIEVDIPRCHQYNELLSSPAAHTKLQRVLKSWVVAHKQYVYWQGLDSLAAPLVYLHFNDEPLAYACLSAFIDKYLHDFFLKDNAAVIQEYLAVFSQLIAFHDPVLFQHLHGIGFVPDLYAIPWFLTMFTHVFPLHKIFHIWDVLLLNDSNQPLCIGFGILQCLRDGLLSAGFNECILLFSDMPDISMEEVIKVAARVRELTPDSVLHREHAPISERCADDVMRSQPISLLQLKDMLVPRISADDLIARMNTANSPLILDIRPTESYQNGNLAGSINVPPGDDLVTSLGSLMTSVDRLTVVVGENAGDSCSEVVETLLSHGCKYVCVLHGGAQVLLSSGLITSCPSR